MNKFKGSNGKWLTTSLFLETSNYMMDRPKWLSEALYTLKDIDKEVDGKVFPSLRRLFVETEDPTGYTLATEHLGGWVHYQALLKGSLAPYIRQWLEEIEVRLRAKGLKKIIEQASANNRQAAEFLTQRKWHIKPQTTKKEKEKRTKQDGLVGDEVEDDYKRLLTTQGKSSEARH